MDTKLNFLNYYGNNWSDSNVIQFEVSANRGFTGQRLDTSTEAEAVLGSTALSEANDPKM